MSIGPTTTAAASPPGAGAPPKHVGFFSGLASVARGVGFVATHPRTWPYAVVPAVVLVTLGAAAVGLVVTVLAPALEGWLPPGGDTGWAGTAAGVGRAAVRWLALVLASLLGLFGALALTPPLAAPALERIVGHVEREVGAPARAELGLLAEMACGLRAQLFAWAVAGPPLALLWLVGVLVPPASVVVVPLQVALTALTLAWNLLDYPLTLRGVRMRARARFLRRHASAVLGFGLGFAALFAVPCFGVLLLPCGAAGATLLLWRLAAADPEPWSVPTEEGVTDLARHAASPDGGSG
ncbi:MAG: EI24 domain-containing protein [Polyangiaceae bacterium]|nr:EI24 domain-containing protein [Polyangiaceae bacterium]